MKKWLILLSLIFANLSYSEIIAHEINLEKAIYYISTNIDDNDKTYLRISLKNGFNINYYLAAQGDNYLVLPTLISANMRNPYKGFLVLSNYTVFSYRDNMCEMKNASISWQIIQESSKLDTYKYDLYIEIFNKNSTSNYRYYIPIKKLNSKLNYSKLNYMNLDDIFYGNPRHIKAYYEDGNFSIFYPVVSND